MAVPDEPVYVRAVLTNVSSVTIVFSNGEVAAVGCLRNAWDVVRALNAARLGEPVTYVTRDGALLFIDRVEGLYFNSTSARSAARTDLVANALLSAELDRARMATTDLYAIPAQAAETYRMHARAALEGVSTAARVRACADAGVAVEAFEAVIKALADQDGAR